MKTLRAKTSFLSTSRCFAVAIALVLAFAAVPRTALAEEANDVPDEAAEVSFEVSDVELSEPNPEEEELDEDQEQLGADALDGSDGEVEVVLDEAEVSDEESASSEDLPDELAEEVTDDEPGVEEAVLEPAASPTPGWNLDSKGNWRWYSDSLVAASGWKRIGGTWYYFDPKTKVMKCDESFVSDGATYVAAASGACPASSWVKASGKWYLTDSSCAARSGWARSGGAWYYLDPSTCAMKENEAFKADGTIYVASASGACPARSWVQANGKWYLTDGSCAARSGWAKSGASWYYLDPKTRVMKEDEAFKVDKVIYVANASGACPASSWVKAAGKWYLTDGSCAARKGWASVGGNWYYLDPKTCIMKENESFEADEMTYVAEASGACGSSRDWVLVEGVLYHDDEISSVLKGWNEIDGIWYYYDPSTGKRKSSEVFEVGGKTYVARADGSCPENAWVGVNGKWYRTDGSCAVRKGWMSTGVTWYYFDPDDQGASVTGTRTIDGTTYFFHSPMGGLASYEYVTLEDGTRAYINRDGIVSGVGPASNVPRDTAGWILYDGDWYYVDGKTHELKTGWIDYKGNKYWLDSEGIMVTGTQLIDGKSYWFDTSGALVKELTGTAEDLINAAKADVGYNVASDPQRGSKFGRWYNENANPYKGSVDYGANGVAYCVMAVSYWLDQANVGAPGFPRAGCEGAALYARMESRAVAPNEIEAGMLVLFDWDRDGEPDHIGIVEERASSRLFKTVEGNTTSGVAGSQSNGGWVAERTRDIDSIYCGIKPYYM